MARQFYVLSLTKNTPQTLHFELPVRKLVVAVQGSVSIQVGPDVLSAQHFTAQDVVFGFRFPIWQHRERR